jgi:cysteinyl-tRNA synthetase
MLKFTNTLSGELEEFVPLEDGKARLYVCGPTVWDFAHIGNFRTFTFGDILRRYLIYKGFEVTYVMNLTDVDDRIINEAAKKGISIDKMTAPFITAFNEDMASLGNLVADIQPRATEHIPEMIDIIQKLLDNGKAYESDGSIYFRITEFPAYGKLAKINFEGNKEGASERVDSDKYDKEDARDFALWKLVDDPDATGWDAPFGRGRPGWHIECSAMSMKYLGETFDIHAGGADLKFPHHENEIAQSEGSTGNLFSKYWLHAEFLKVDNDTMSKTLGNAHTLRDVMKQGFSALAIRYMLISAPYKKQLNFTFEGLKGSETSVGRLKQFRRLVAESSGDEGSFNTVANTIKEAVGAFDAAMDDDLNTARALAAIHDLVSEINIVLADGNFRQDDRDAVLAAVDGFNSVLGIFGEDESGEILDEDIEKLIAERQEARNTRDFARSDEIRDELAEKGIVLEDTKDGVRWKRG